MAGTLAIRGMIRPVESAAGSGGMTGDLAIADAVLVGIDRFSNGIFGHIRRLAFADYAGLEAEWDAGVAVTVLVAAVDTAITATDMDMGVLSAAQRAAAETAIEI